MENILKSFLNKIKSYGTTLGSIIKYIFSKPRKLYGINLRRWRFIGYSDCYFRPEVEGEAPERCRFHYFVRRGNNLKRKVHAVKRKYTNFENHAFYQGSMLWESGEGHPYDYVFFFSDEEKEKIVNAHGDEGRQFIQNRFELGTGAANSIAGIQTSSQQQSLSKEQQKYLEAFKKQKEEQKAKENQPKKTPFKVIEGSVNKEDE